MPKDIVQHICSRGHTYTGSGRCPECWPSGAKKDPKGEPVAKKER